MSGFNSVYDAASSIVCLSISFSAPPAQKCIYTPPLALLLVSELNFKDQLQAKALKDNLLFWDSTWRSQ